MRLNRPALPRPRLLPATIVAMSALLVCKSVILVQAAVAGEASAPVIAATPSVPAPGQPPMALPGPAPAPAPAAASVKPAQDQPEGDAAPVSGAERAVLLDLRRRHDSLDARAHDLDQREAEMAAADQRLTERVQQLATLQARLEALEAGRQAHLAENWSGLVKTYEAMKPRDAALIFDALDMQVLLQVLDRMQERRAAPVLAAMQPDRARLATQMLAEMRTRAATVAMPVAAHTDTKG